MISISRKVIVLFIILTFSLVFISGCENATDTTDKGYDYTLKIEYLKEADLENLNILVNDENYSEFVEVGENGVFTLNLSNLEGEKTISIAHDNLFFTPEQFKITEDNDEEIKKIYTKYVIVDKTEGNRFKLENMSLDDQKENHEYIFYPGEYYFGKDFEVLKSGISIKGRKGYENTRFEFDPGYSVKLNADNITFTGIKVNTEQSENGVGYGLQVGSDTKGITITDSDIDGVLAQNNVSDLEIKNNELHDALYQGVHLGQNNTNVLIEKNEIYNVSWHWENTDTYGYEGIYVSEESENISIIDNIIRDNFAQAISLVGSEAEIINNKLANNEYDGIIIWPEGKGVIKNKLIDNNGRGIFLRENTEATIENNTIEHNGRGVLIFSENTVINSSINYNNIVINQKDNLHVVKYDSASEEYIVTDNSLNAKNNWWGSQELSKEGYEVKNQLGELVVYGNIDYTPYLEEPFTDAGLK